MHFCHWPFCGFYRPYLKACRSHDFNKVTKTARDFTSVDNSLFCVPEAMDLFLVMFSLLRSVHVNGTDQMFPLTCAVVSPCSLFCLQEERSVEILGDKKPAN